MGARSLVYFIFRLFWL